MPGKVAGYKAGDPHEGDAETASKLGTTKHVDAYAVNAAGKRAAPHSSDVKISHDSSKPEVRDIKPPAKNK